MKLCECGCGESIPDRDKYGESRRFKGYHHNRGKYNPMLGKPRPDTLERNKKAVGEKHPSWRGDDVQYTQLHKWVRKHLPEPAFCQWIGCVEPPYELCNVTGVYTRDFDNWQYYCRSDHEKFDIATGMRKPGLRDSKGRFISVGWKELDNSKYITKDIISDKEFVEKNKVD